MPNMPPDQNQQLTARHSPGTNISTGHLPRGEAVRSAILEAFEEFRTNTDGENSHVYPALESVPSDLFAICVSSTRGDVFAVGDADHPFPMMSVSKPFVFALVCDSIGPDSARAALGANATGLPFNSLIAVELGTGGVTNPMVNSGAITTSSLVPGPSLEDKWQSILAGLSRFAGRRLSFNDDVYKSAMATNYRNRSIANLLYARGALTVQPEHAIDLYTRQCSLDVTVGDLSVMGATLANGGVNPVTHERIVDGVTCQYVLAVMITAGLYETSGDWLYHVGMPGKSGIAGGVVTVAPGKGSLATFAPRLDAAGNSIKGQLVARHLSHQLGLHMLSSEPDVPQAERRAGDD
jgi:glutaminase